MKKAARILCLCFCLNGSLIFAQNKLGDVSAIDSSSYVDQQLPLPYPVYLWNHTARDKRGNVFTTKRSYPDNPEGKLKLKREPPPQVDVVKNSAGNSGAETQVLDIGKRMISCVMLMYDSLRDNLIAYGFYSDSLLSKRYSNARAKGFYAVIIDPVTFKVKQTTAQDFSKELISESGGHLMECYDYVEDGELCSYRLDGYMQDIRLCCDSGIYIIAEQRPYKTNALMFFEQNSGSPNGAIYTDAFDFIGNALVIYLRPDGAIGYEKLIRKIQEVKREDRNPNYDPYFIHKTGNSVFVTVASNKLNIIYNDDAANFNSVKKNGPDIYVQGKSKTNLVLVQISGNGTMEKDVLATTMKKEPYCIVEKTYKVPGKDEIILKKTDGSCLDVKLH